MPYQSRVDFCFTTVACAYAVQCKASLREDLPLLQARTHACMHGVGALLRRSVGAANGSLTF